MLGRRAATSRVASNSSWLSAARWSPDPKYWSSTSRPKGIQPSIIKDIGRALQFLRDEKWMTILLVEQFLDFCREVADDIYVMDRGEIMHKGPASDLDLPDVRKHLMV